ncbi:inositol-phosphate phosphatase [Marinitoga sp. 1197]|uniref:inositol monophosphatase family protein n=1 Tax=Marinitoga sp. 1197 TaxID=1428449 RepID=UPI000640D0E4|nr:inositol monophosphatase family protein [Marinitoga sp. 1197]KLO23414.1 inositol-phosphate phosphatase [Marinitoga sp. 1197]
MKEFDFLKEKVIEVGKKLLEWREKEFTISSKSSKHDLVTSLDLRVQEFLYNTLTQKFPDIGFLGEENGKDKKPKTNGYWVIDPIDGTVNFSKMLPMFCISAAYVENDEPKYGIIYAPVINQIITAEENKGIKYNDEKIIPNWAKSLDDAMISMGNIRGKTFKFFESFETKVMRIRLLGTAALQIAYVGTGYFDAFISVKGNPWDVAAGYIIVKEAGGIITDYYGNKTNIFNKKNIYSNPYIYKDIIKNLQGVLL